jgi:hypothetical protein
MATLHQGIREEYRRALDRHTTMVASGSAATLRQAVREEIVRQYLGALDRGTAKHVKEILHIAYPGLDDMTAADRHLQAWRYAPSRRTHGPKVQNGRAIQSGAVPKPVLDIDARETQIVRFFTRLNPRQRKLVAMREGLLGYREHKWREIAETFKCSIPSAFQAHQRAKATWGISDKQIDQLRA